MDVLFKTFSYRNQVFQVLITECFDNRTNCLDNRTKRSIIKASLNYLDNVRLLKQPKRSGIQAKPNKSDVRLSQILDSQERMETIIIIVLKSVINIDDTELAEITFILITRTECTI